MADEPAGSQPQQPSREATMKTGPVIALMVLVGVVVIGIIGAISSSSESDTPSTSYTARPDVKSTVQVVYLLSGSAGSINITAKSATGTEQASGALVPARLVYEMRPGDFAYVSAQNDGEYGDVTCLITVDGVAISSNTASGAYTVASCQGTIP
jgi:hypothetical protein